MFKEHNEKLVKKNKAIFLQNLLEKKEREKAYSEALKEGRARIKKQKEPPLRLNSNGYCCWKTGRPVFISYDELTEEEIENLVEEGVEMNRKIDY